MPLSSDFQLGRPFKPSDFHITDADIRAAFLEAQEELTARPYGTWSVVNLFCTVCKTNHYSLGWKEKSKGLNSRAFSVISEILSSIDLPCFEIH